LRIKQDEDDEERLFRLFSNVGSPVSDGLILGSVYLSEARRVPPRIVADFDLFVQRAREFLPLLRSLCESPSFGIQALCLDSRAIEVGRSLYQRWLRRFSSDRDLSTIENEHRSDPGSTFALIRETSVWIRQCVPSSFDVVVKSLTGVERKSIECNLTSLLVDWRLGGIIPNLR
jgi:hypothetical protein